MVALSFIGGGNRSTWRKPPTCRKTLSHNVVSSTPRLKEIGTHNVSVDRHTDCIGSYKYNYHTIMTMTAPKSLHRYDELTEN